MSRQKQNKKAFTMIEVIFVIIILGIISSIGSTIIAQLYENYILQRAIHRVSLKTELAVNQIVNRLTYRIPNSVIAKNPTTKTFIKLEDVSPGITDINNSVLEWIGYDNDSFSAQARPGWSGYCDTSSSNTTTNALATPGSNLNASSTIITNLGGNIAQLALLFGLNGAAHNTANIPQDADCYGYGGNTTCIHQVTITPPTTLTTNQNAVNIATHYKLAWTAYALVPVAPSDGTAISNTNFDLALYYNYQPWNATQYDNNATSSSIILRKATAFKFSELGGTLRIKLCATEQIGDASTTNISVCKEKVVIR
jgi:prepilin-type N-terminal cleavage/methylation domain-containing protein